MDKVAATNLRIRIQRRMLRVLALRCVIDSRMDDEHVRKCRFGSPRSTDERNGVYLRVVLD